jgi:hypothetical protein
MSAGVDEAQAAETLKILTELGEAQAELESINGSEAAYDGARPPRPPPLAPTRFTQ